MKKLIFLILALGLFFPLSRVSTAPQSQAQFHEIFRVGRGTIYHVDWHPNAPMILADTASGAWLYDDHLQDVAYLEGIRLARFSPDGQYIAGINSQHEVLILDMLTQKVIATLNGHEANILYLEWGLDSKYLATGDYGQVFVWDISTQTSVFQRKITKLGLLLWNPNTQYLATLSLNGSIGIWTIEGKLKNILSIHPISVYIRYNLDWLDETGLMYISFGSDGGSQIKLWNVLTKELTTRGFGSAESVSLSADRRFVAFDNILSLVVLDTKTWENVATYDYGDGDNQVIEPMLNNVLFSPDNRFVAVGSLDYNNDTPDPLFHIFDVKTQQNIGLFSQRNEFVSVKVLGWSPDSQKILTIDFQNILRLWSVSKPTPLYTQDKHALVTSVFSSSPDYQAIAIADNLNQVHIWDTDTQTITSTLTGHDFPVTGVFWRPETDLLMLATYSGSQSPYYISSDASVRIWNTDTGKQLFQYEQPAVNSGGWQPNGHVFGTSSSSTLTFWDSGTKQLRQIDLSDEFGYGGVISRSFAWSPEGNKFSIYEYRGVEATIEIYTFPTLELLGSYVQSSGHAYFNTQAVWLDNGTKMIAARSYRYTLGVPPTYPPISIWTVYPADSEDNYAREFGVDSFIDFIVLSPNGSQMIIQPSEGCLGLWEIASHKLLWELPDTGRPTYHHIFGASWSPNSQYIVWYDFFQKELQILESATSAIIQRIPVSSYPHFEWSDDSKRLVIGADGVVLVWEREG